MDYLNISSEINFDIYSGIYNQYPKLKNKLERLSTKLNQMHYVQNMHLTSEEISLLTDNEYLEI